MLREGMLLGSNPKVCLVRGSQYISEISDRQWLCPMYFAQVHEATEDGDCGRPYYVPKYGIVGIHSLLYTEENITGMTAIFNESDSMAPAIECEMRLKPAVIPAWDSACPTYTAEWNDVAIHHFTPLQTEFTPIVGRDNKMIIEDDISDFSPSQKRPIETPDGYVIPLYHNAQKYDIEQSCTIPQRIMNMAIRHFVTKYPKLRDTRVLTEYQTINGYGLMVQVNMNSSPGIWQKLGFKNGKKDMFEALPQEQDTNGQLKQLEYKFSSRARDEIVPMFNMSFCQRLQMLEEQLKEGIVLTPLVLTAMKDELRSKKKVMNGKTRVFEQCSLEWTLLFRKYFGAFLNFYKSKAGFEFYHGIGRDKEAVWKQYAEGLLTNAPEGHAFDYSNWDGSVPSCAFAFFRAVTDDYYGEASLVRHGLIHGLQHAYHVIGQYVFETHQGNKSGNPFTDVFNSICNTFVMYMCFINAQYNEGVTPSLRVFDDNIKMLTYGDDVVMTVKPAILKWFDGPTIQATCEGLGITITSASKGAVPASCSFKELTFLKSHFVCEKGVWLAPMPIPDIFKELRYRPKSTVGDFNDLQNRVNNVNRFLSHHNEETYNKYVTELSKFSTSLVTIIPDCTREQIVHEIYLLQQQEAQISGGSTYLPITQN
jgi:hypothetical protein